jgi:NAD(P)-dependent dehydrogenase (short-subunit alcohol dehydrogenase family)
MTTVHPMNAPIALVTGGNRGIGLEVVRQLAQRGMRVLMGSRSLEAGERAAAGLLMEPATGAELLQASEGRESGGADMEAPDRRRSNLHPTLPLKVGGLRRVERTAESDPSLRQPPQEESEAGSPAEGDAGAGVTVIPLDVADSASIRAAADIVAERFGRLDVLVNNAGVYLDEGVSALDVPRDVMRTTFETNLFGVIETVQVFAPLLRKADEARVINVSSGYGQWDGMSADVPAYCLSKLALNGATLMLARKLKGTASVNAVCPGWVRTDMGGPNATRSVEEGADTIVWLATEAPPTLSGKLIRDRREVPW